MGVSQGYPRTDCPWGCPWGCPGGEGADLPALELRLARRLDAGGDVREEPRVRALSGGERVADAARAQASEGRAGQQRAAAGGEAAEENKGRPRSRGAGGKSVQAAGAGCRAGRRGWVGARARRSSSRKFPSPRPRRPRPSRSGPQSPPRCSAAVCFSLFAFQWETHACFCGCGREGGPWGVRGAGAPWTAGRTPCTAPQTLTASCSSQPAFGFRRFPSIFVRFRRFFR